MTLVELRDLFRLRADDRVKKYRFADDSIDLWHNEALSEACERGDLIAETEDAAMCEVPVSEGVSTFTLDPRWTRITSARWQDSGGDETPLEIMVDPQVLDSRSSTWRTDTGTPNAVVIQDLRCRLSRVPDADGTVILEGFRLPAELKNDSDEPEIAEVHHRRLVDWAIFRAYSVPDSETQDPTRAQGAMDNFERYFGPRPDKDQKQGSEAAPFVQCW